MKQCKKNIPWVFFFSKNFRNYAIEEYSPARIIYYFNCKIDTDAKALKEHNNAKLS